MFPKKRAIAALFASTALALTACGSGGEETAPEATESFDPQAAVSLNFTWWGNDDRAARYEQLIAAFNEEYPNIEINGTFTDFPSYWEKKQTEAAGGGLPDVWQFSDSYLRQYADLVEAVRSGRLPAVTAQDGRDAVELITAAYESSRTGREIGVAGSRP